MTTLVAAANDSCCSSQNPYASSMDTPTNSFTSLQPYKHQVGGHFGMFSLGADTRHICKHKNEVEADFYAHMPNELRPITARCCYEVELAYNESTDDYSNSISDTRFNPSSTESKCCGEVKSEKSTPPPPTKAEQERDIHSTDSAIGTDNEGEGDQEEERLLPINSTPATPTPTAPPPSPPSPPRSPPSEADEEEMFRDVGSGFSSAVNPWAFQCQLKNFKRMDKDRSASTNLLMFENLTSRFQHPCIIDLKLGTRQHGDGASREKRLLQQWKCRRTTSKEMGLRVCGMQCYDSSSRTYQCLDKYQGRALDRKGMQKMLGRFFSSSTSSTNNNRNRVRMEVTKKAIERVKHMREVIAGVDGLRLFGTSLLIVIEGEGSGRSGEEVEARLIDFANVSYNNTNTTNGYSGPDEGCLLGLDSLIAILSKLIT